MDVLADSFEVLRKDLSEISENVPMEAVALHAAGAYLRSGLRDMRGEELFAKWGRYVSTHGVHADEPFGLRYHLERFAEEAFSPETVPCEVLSVPISQLTDGTKTYGEVLSDYVHESIIYDPTVAIKGGAAKPAIHMLAGHKAERGLPINDIDLIVSTDSADPGKTAEKYGADLAGAKIVDGDIVSKLGAIFAETDCTVNQIAVSGGHLYYTEAALQDTKEGNIRLVGANKALFPSDSYKMPDGNVYITRPGFYRGLSLLVRGRGDRLIVSQENLNAEAKNIGRYWQILLYVKIIPIKDDASRHQAIAHWHDIAKRIGSTDSETPVEFLEELTELFPETRVRAGKKKQYDAAADVRWLMGKLLSRSVDYLAGRSEKLVLPQTYTPANIERSPKPNDFDIKAFEQQLNLP